MLSICMKFKKNVEISAPSWREMVTKYKGLIIKCGFTVFLSSHSSTLGQSFFVNCVLEKIRLFDQ